MYSNSSELGIFLFSDVDQNLGDRLSHSGPCNQVESLMMLEIFDPLETMSAGFCSTRTMIPIRRGGQFMNLFNSISNKGLEFLWGSFYLKIRNFRIGPIICWDFQCF